MKLSKKQFDSFRKYCWYYLKLFDLDKRWDILIKEDYKIIGCLAKVYRDDIKRTATILLCAGWDKEDNKPIEEKIKGAAKHECIHLLLADLIGLAGDRFITPPQIEKAEEELIMILIKLLPDES